MKGRINFGVSQISPLSSSVLVLNKHYSAIRVVDAKRAFCLLYKNYAEAVEEDSSRFQTLGFKEWIDFSTLRASKDLHEDLFIHTPKYEILVPKVIRLVRYDKYPKSEIKFNRKNILARDANTCQYCGKRFPSAKLSIDHVVPKSRGGKSTWTNVVAACNLCNTKKGDRLPSEAGLRLIRKPFAPLRNPLVGFVMKNQRYKIWQQFLPNARFL